MLKYLLCRTRSGLNDTLCQIEKSWLYATRTSRHLVIDTRQSGLMADFGDFFIPINPDDMFRVNFSLSNELVNQLNSCSAFPVEIQKKIDTYRIKWVPGERFYRDATTSAILSFDFEKQYEEELLVSEDVGGGNASHNAIRRVVFTNHIAEAISERIATLGESYDAIHIRNTDYLTDFESFFKNIYEQVANRRVLVCSDDARVIDFARNFFRESEILTLPTGTNPVGKPLHYRSTYSSDQERREATVRSLVDLVALAGSAKLHTTTVNSQSGQPLGIRSGFSNLCIFLNQNKSIIDNLLQSARTNQ